MMSDSEFREFVRVLLAVFGTACLVVAAIVAGLMVGLLWIVH